MHDRAIHMPKTSPTRPAWLVSARTDVLVFSAATAVLALHAAVDSFIAPEPGTGPGDHLLRDAASLAVLALAAAVYPRLPAGGRAALALVLGALALEGAALAVADARAVGPRGEDWTGFLLFPTGVLLLGSATILLWRSRKPGGLRYLRRAGIAVAAILAAYWLVVPVAIAVLATHRPRADVAPAELGRPYEELTIRTSDGLGLAAWYVPSLQRGRGHLVSNPPGEAAAGPDARPPRLRRASARRARLRRERGRPEPVRLGRGQGHRCRRRLAARRPDVTGGRIGGIGFSVGGEMMLQAAASNTGLRGVVSEGAGVRSVHEDIVRGPRGWLALPEAAVQTAAVAVLSGTGTPPSLTDLLPRISPRPLLLVYAGRGGGGEELNADYYRAAHAPKGLWKIAEAGHVGGFQARPRAYEERVTRFFDRALLGPR